MKKIKYVLYSFSEVYKHGTAFFWLFIFKSFVATCRFYLSVWLSRSLINEIAYGITTQQISLKLINVAIMIISSDILFAFINLIIDYFSELSATKYNNFFTIKNAQKASRLKMEFHDNPNDKNEFKQFLSDGKSVMNLYCQTVTLVVSLFSFCVSLYISFSFSIIITIAALVVSLPTFFVRKRNKNADYRFEKELNLTDRIIDYYKSVITGRTYYKEIHVFNSTNYFFSLLKAELNKRLDKRRELKKSKIIRETALLVIYSIVNIAINMYIIIYIVLKRLTIGDYSYYTSIINNLKNNSDTIVTSISNLLLSISKVENYYLFLYSKDNEYPLGSQPMPSEITTIQFKNVSFKYPSSKEYVIKDVSFCIKKGEKIAFAGVNGAGKTTLINLLLRFYEPTSGCILLNSQDIKIYDLHEYWSYFSCMFQKNNLYNITLKENLMLGQINKMRSSSDEALCAFLSSLGLNIDKKMLNNYVSKQFYESGMIFSPGQAQKIGVVRTLLKNSPILILDEPSSAMDAISEDLIMETAFSLSKGKMLFFVSHRLSNLRKVDRIIFLSNGRVEEIGSHNELMNNKSMYFDLYNKQSKKYI